MRAFDLHTIFSLPAIIATTTNFIGIIKTNSTIQRKGAVIWTSAGEGILDTNTTIEVAVEFGSCSVPMSFVVSSAKGNDFRRRWRIIVGKLTFFFDTLIIWVGRGSED